MNGTPCRTPCALKRFQTIIRCFTSVIFIHIFWLAEIQHLTRCHSAFSLKVDVSASPLYAAPPFPSSMVRFTWKDAISVFFCCCWIVPFYQALLVGQTGLDQPRDPGLILQVKFFGWTWPEKLFELKQMQLVRVKCFYQALVVCPGAKLEVAYLLVKGEPGHVHLDYFAR